MALPGVTGAHAADSRESAIVFRCKAAAEAGCGRCVLPAGVPGPQWEAVKAGCEGARLQVRPGLLSVWLSARLSIRPSLHRPGRLPTQQPRGLQMGSQPDLAPAPGQATQGVPFGPWRPPRAQWPCLPLPTRSLLCCDRAVNAQVSTACPGEEAPPITLPGLLAQSRGAGRPGGAGSSSRGWGALGQAQPGSARAPGHCCPH